MVSNQPQPDPCGANSAALTGNFGVSLRALRQLPRVEIAPSLSEQLHAALERQERRVATHLRVDLDAIMSTALWAHLVHCSVDDLDVHFVPAITEQVDSGVVALDIPAGLKGHESSCFEQLLAFAPKEEQEALALFAHHVTLQDRGELLGLPREVHIGCLGPVIGALKDAMMNDRALLSFGGGLFHAQLTAGRELVLAHEALVQAQQLAEGRVVVLPPNVPRITSTLAFEGGAEIVIFQQELNVGAQRRHDSSVHLGKLLEAVLPEGFFRHPNGWLVAWGTEKSPASDRSPLSALELGALIARLLPRSHVALPPREHSAHHEGRADSGVNLPDPSKA